MQKKKQILIDFIVILWVTVLASVPLIMGGIHRGHDIGFHLLRIEGIAEELKRLQFPVRMQSLWLDGYSYPVSIYYGDLLLYIPATLRLIGFPIITAYKIYIFFMNATTAASAYFCFNKMWRHRQIAAIVCLAYVTAGYRMVDIYVRAAVGEYSAMAFFPLIALSLYQIYMSKEGGRAERHKNALLLCFGITGVIETHLLTTEMTVFVLTLLCIVLWKKTFQKKIILTYLLAIIEVLLLNLHFIIPFFDYYYNVDANINVLGQTNQIQSEGAYLIQYFSFFQNIFGYSGIDIKERMQLSTGPLLLSALAFGVMAYRKKRNKKICLYMGFSFLMLLFASNIFPWNFLAKKFMLGNILAQVQFPWRYLTFAILFLSLLLGEILKDMFFISHQKRSAYLITAISICTFMVCCFTGNYIKGAEKIYFQKTEELSTYEIGVGEEFLLAGTKISILSDNDKLSGNFKEANLIFRDGTHMELFMAIGDECGIVELPLFCYKGYCVTDEYGIEYRIKAGSNNRLQFQLPAGYSGKIYVDFTPPYVLESRRDYFCRVGYVDDS